MKRLRRLVKQKKRRRKEKKKREEEENRKKAEKIQRDWNKAELEKKRMQEAEDAETARRIAEEDKLLMETDPEPAPRTNVAPVFILSKAKNEDIRPTETYDAPDNLETLDMPIYGQGRLILLADPLPKLPKESKEQYAQREIERAKMFYAKHLNSPKHLLSRSKVRQITKPTKFMFQRARCVKFEVTRFDGSVTMITNGDFPHLNPADIFQFLKLVNKPQSGKTSQIFNHHKRLLKNFMQFYVHDLCSLDVELHPIYCKDLSHSPPQPNKSSAEFPIKLVGYADSPTRAILYLHKDHPTTPFAFRMDEKHLYSNRDLESMKKFILKLKMVDVLKKRLIEEIEWFQRVRIAWREMAEYVKPRA